MDVVRTASTMIVVVWGLCGGSNATITAYDGGAESTTIPNDPTITDTNVTFTVRRDSGATGLLKTLQHASIQLV